MSQENTSMGHLGLAGVTVVYVYITCKKFRTKKRPKKKLSEFFTM